MASFPFELVSPERIIFSGEVETVVIPASEGEMTLLADHAPMMTSLKTGFLVVGSGKGEERILVQGGFVDVGPKGATVLAERAMPVSEVTGDILAREISRAETEHETVEDPVLKAEAADTVAQLREAKARLGL
ncbi:F0F1 ATP synthase subunit epsilon [Salinarimonas rosea]|uniref:F0F1 ATP synthase subunit epsilon n=1 Tax=Salinarimonas rosea TaxID=552063 RepID=UPI0004188067|nr:F0F1 ATP synthase subunit epsilon [Salinarimonas rosea]